MRFGRRNPREKDEPAIDISEKDGIRSLHLGSDAIQSSMRIKDPYELVLSYSRCMFGFLLLRDEPSDLVLIGLGGGSIPKFVHRHMPETRVVAVELLPQIVTVARSMFHLPPDDERLSVVVDDGAAYVEALSEPVGAIMLDAFGPTGIAPPLSTERFFGICRDRLVDDGVLLVNLWGSDPRFSTYVERLSNAFDGLVLCLPARQKGNIAALAFKRPSFNPSWAKLHERAVELENRYPIEFREFVSDLARMNLHNDRRLLI